MLVGRKLKLYTKLEIDESDGVLKDEVFDPEELQVRARHAYVLPLPSLALLLTRYTD